ncbi:hypothetical protein R1flu_026846 [Riccia fluitans]|uniref:Uncharacterized protein n=1 Tax=Riccia fluitans TaxID=41844 RepID=A0ABD1XH35_9MARC
MAYDVNEGHQESGRKEAETAGEWHNRTLFVGGPRDMSATGFGFSPVPLPCSHPLAKQRTAATLDGTLFHNRWIVVAKWVSNDTLLSSSSGTRLLWKYTREERGKEEQREAIAYRRREDGKEKQEDCRSDSSEQGSRQRVVKAKTRRRDELIVLLVVLDYKEFENVVEVEEEGRKRFHLGAQKTGIWKVDGRRGGGEGRVEGGCCMS